MRAFLAGVFWIGVIVALATAARAADAMRLHDSGVRMDWDAANEYCRSLDAYVPPLNAMEAAFRDSYVSRGGASPYQKEAYWTSDELDIDGAYAFDFATGLHTVDFKNSRYRVMCIKSDFED